MGNNINMGASSKAAKVMKIDGEIFKFKTPAKVLDVIKDYPDHVLLDSDDFLRYNLRAKPLDPNHQLQTKKLYLLVQLPHFPIPLRRVRSSGLDRPRRGEVVKTTRRSLSDVSIVTQSLEVDGINGSSMGPTTRVKIRLKKAAVDRIMEESRNEAEVAERILGLCFDGSAAGNIGREVLPPVAEDSGGGSGGQERESRDEDAAEVDRNRSCLNVHAMCSPCIYPQRKYKRLPSM